MAEDVLVEAVEKKSLPPLEFDLHAYYPRGVMKSPDAWGLKQQKGAICALYRFTTLKRSAGFRWTRCLNRSRGRTRFWSG